MTSVQRSSSDERDLRWFWFLIACAGTATLLAAGAGLASALADPAEGSTGEDVLDWLAAVGGLGAAFLFGAAAVWAQVRNLWRFAPRWFRWVVWGAMAVLLIVAVVAGSRS